MIVKYTNKIEMAETGTFLSFSIESANNTAAYPGIMLDN